MNGFFKKSPQRKWTWASPDGVTRNEIDFIITNNRNMVHDVSVLNNCSIGISDHRLVRVKITIHLERTKIVNKKHQMGWTHIENIQVYEEAVRNGLEEAD